MGGRAAKDAGEAELSRALLGIVSEPNNPGPWLQAGWALVDDGWSDLAIPLLEEAHRIEPANVEARESLVIAYSDEGRHDEVVAIASGMNPMERPSIAFPLAWSALMVRRVEQAERVLGSLAKIAQQAVEARGVFIKAAAALERYRAFSPEDDIRHWHYVQYGGITLDLCDDLDLAGGRYNLVSLSYEQVAAVLRALVAVGQELEVPLGPWGFVNRDGEVIARALGQLTGKPVQKGIPPEGWLVMGDPRDIESCRNEFDKHAPKVRTFCFSFPWVTWGPKVMDVTGMWVELAVLPWNGGWGSTAGGDGTDQAGGSKFIAGRAGGGNAAGGNASSGNAGTSATGGNAGASATGGNAGGGNAGGGSATGVREIPIDRRPTEEIANDIVAAAASAPAPPRELLEFVRARRDYLTIIQRDGPRGLPYVPDAPLPFASLSGVLG